MGARFIPFRIRILGAFWTLLAVVLGVSLAVASRAQKRSAEAAVRSQLEITSKVFAGLLGTRRRQLETAVDLLGRDFAIKQAIATRDGPTIASNAESLKARIPGADVVWISDEEGVLYADTSGHMARGQSIAATPVYKSAVEDGVGSALQSLGPDVYQLVAVPLAAPDVLGVLVAGFRLDDEFAAELKGQTDSDVTFAAGDRLLASTLPGPRRSALESARASLQAGSLSLVGDRGMQDLVRPVAVAPEVTAYLQRSWDEALEPLRELLRLLLLVGLAALAVTAAAGLLVARGVTAPIAKLAGATDRVMRHDYSVSVDIPRRDEIGRLGEAFNQMVAGLREGEEARSVLNKAVSPEIAEELLSLKRRGELRLGGEERQVTVLFSDIRSFTTISEALKPQELVSQLNAYFTAMSAAIDARRGVIDKYVGDAIMALFGAPQPAPGHAADSLRAALGMVEGLRRLNAERRSAGLAPWEAGIGLNSGPAVAGNMGSENRLSYTVIGDAVNLASRLEGLTKHYGVRVAVSGSVRAAAGPGFRFRTLDLVRVKGKKEPVEVFELLGEEGDTPPAAAPAAPKASEAALPRVIAGSGATVRMAAADVPAAWLAPFEAGVQAYRRAEFKSAQARFEEVLRLSPEDKPARLYLERLGPLLASVPEGWEPAHTMLEK